MAFKEVSSLDAEITVALGKKDKSGKPYPKQAEGFYLGSRTVPNKRGESKIHFLQTAKGNLGVWGTTDLDRKIGQVNPGSMVRITSTGTKPTPNGEMYTYKVEIDDANTIEVNLQQESAGVQARGADSDDNDEDTSYVDNDTPDDSNEDDEDALQAEALAIAERKAKVQELLKKKNKAS